jgi:hypothetical protein
MKHSQTPGKANPPAGQELKNLVNEMLHEIHYPAITTVAGFESLSIGESFSLFFAELSTSIDKRLSLLAKSIHTVNFDQTRLRLKKENILYVKNTTVPMLTPEGYLPGMGSMMLYTKNVALGVYIVSSLKTEASRLYDWLKDIVSKGRMGQEFRWSIGDFGQALTKAENFIKGLPDNGRTTTQNLGVVYSSFEEMWDVIHTYNVAVKNLGSRDAEMISKIITDVFEIGQLLVKKIKANDLILTPEAIAEVEGIVNRFRDFTNVAGVMMVLLNELTAVFQAQVKSLDALKY